MFRRKLMDNVWLKASELITPSRLDITAKILLARSYKVGLGAAFASSLYRATLTAMNPLGKFGEDNVKFSLEDYETAFRRLYESMRDRGFDPKFGLIPLSRDGTLQNGAHRVALATVLGLEVEIEMTKEIQQVYDFQFFRRAGLDQHYLRRMAWEFLENNENVRALLLSGFNKTEGNRIANDVGKHCHLLAHEAINLTEIGKRRLMDAAYGHLDWYSKSLREKLVLERFAALSTGQLILYLDDAGPDGSELKQNLRNKYVMDGDVDRRIHGSDNFEETVQLARPFLLKSQRVFMNWAPLGSEESLLNRLEELQFEKSQEGFAFDGGLVVEIFGIRTTDDVDHICLLQKGKCKFSSRYGDCHSASYRSAGLEPEEILHDPDETFVVGGYKFVSPETVALTKRIRGEGKDIVDSSHLESIENRSVTMSSAFSSDNSAARARKWKRRSQIMLWVDRGLEHLPKPVRQLAAEVAAFVRKLK